MSAVIYLTDPDWYDFLCSNPKSVLNCWRKPTYDFHMVGPGELFFCLIRLPIREERFVGAVAKFARYQRLTVRDAWEKYGEANGAASSTELLNSLRRVFREFFTLDDWIGCLILQDFRPVIDGPPLGADLHPSGQQSGKKISDEEAQALLTHLTLSGFEPNTPVAPDCTPPGRTQTFISRIIRDTAITRELKTLYGGRCQICGEGILLENGETYVEAHHVRPLGRHGGLDHPSNVLVLCPNHHAEFDYGAIMVDPAALIVRHSDPSNRWHSSPLNLNPRHQLNPEFLRYHAEKPIFFGASRP